MMKFKKNDCVILTQGAYSAYEILKVFIALKDFDTISIMIVYLNQHKEQAEKHNFNHGNFIKWLISNGFVGFHKAQEWLIAEYNSAIVEYEYEDQLYRSLPDEN